MGPDEGGNVRVVASEIDPRDLTATWEDKQKWGADVDWRTCLVNGKRPGQDEVSDRVTTGGATGGLVRGSTAQGGFGRVLRAVWKNSIKVAIKESTEQSWQKLTHEMQLFLDLHHPHIVACYGILKHAKVTDGGGRLTVHSIVTECCRTNLHSFLHNHRIWEKFHSEPLTHSAIDMRKYKILEHVTQGLEKLHDMCVLHRDLKTLNILLDGEPGECDQCRHSGNWKICDFVRKLFP
jgi:serine/threonine protein kinase